MLTGSMTSACPLGGRQDKPDSPNMASHDLSAFTSSPNETVGGNSRFGMDSSSLPGKLRFRQLYGVINFGIKAATTSFTFSD